MKIFRRILLAVVLLVVVGVVVLYMRLDGIVKNTVETQGSSSLNLKTTLDNAKLSLFGGKLSLSQLQIASPQGYTAPQMFDVGDTSVAVSYGELRKTPVHISSIIIDKPKLVVEQQNGVFNFKKAMDSIPPGDSSAPKGEPLKMVIDDLQVRDAMVVVRPGIPGLPPEINVPVPSIAMKNVGTGDGSQNGAAVKDVVMQVITALAGSASNSADLPAQLKALLGTNVSQTIGQLGAEAQKRIAAAIPGDLGKNLSQIVQDPRALMKDPGKAVQGLTGMLNGKTGDGGSTTQPSNPKDEAVNALQGLLGGKKK